MITNQLTRYMLVGGAATALDMVVFAGVTYGLDYDYRLALCAGFVVGVFLNFCLCDRYIFNRTDCSFMRACARHYGASVTGLALNQLGMTLLISWFNCSWLIGARLIVATFTFVCNFSLIRRFVFRAN